MSRHYFPHARAYGLYATVIVRDPPNHTSSLRVNKNWTGTNLQEIHAMTHLRNSFSKGVTQEKGSSEHNRL